MTARFEAGAPTRTALDRTTSGHPHPVPAYRESPGQDDPAVRPVRALLALVVLTTIAFTLIVLPALPLWANQAVIYPFAGLMGVAVRHALT